MNYSLIQATSDNFLNMILSPTFVRTVITNIAQEGTGLAHVLLKEKTCIRIGCPPVCLVGLVSGVQRHSR